MNVFGSPTGSAGQSLFGGPNSQQQFQQPQQQMQNPFMQFSGEFGNNNNPQQYQQNPFGGGFDQQQMQNPFMQSSGGGFGGYDGYGQQDGYGGYGQQDGYGGYGDQQQGGGQIPEFANPFSRQMQPQQPQQMLTRGQQRREDRLARRNPVDFSQMGQAGQFGTQGFAQGLQDYAGQQYRDYAYNPTNQTFYKGGDKTSQGTTLDQMLQQGRAAGYKMANGGIASLFRKG